MKRFVSPPAGVARVLPARIASFGLAMASLSLAACAPDQSVQPGAPELIAVYVVQAGPNPTKIVPETPDCPTPVANQMCRAGVDPMADPPQTPDTLCRNVAAGHWCNCLADAADTTGMMGTWNCDPFGGVVQVVAIFDRLLDTTPLDPGDEPALTDVAMATAGASTAVPVLTDYGSNGSPKGLVIPLFAVFGAGNFRTEGPSLLTVPASSFPSDTGVTVALNKSKVLAKDGTTPFVGTGALLDGIVKFATAPFAVSLVAPADLGPMSADPNTVTVAFTNLVADVDAVTMHAHATVNGAAAAITVAPVNEATMAISPVDPWPAGATVVVTLDPGVTSVAGDTLATAATLTFMTPTP
jgi:hypothetical protein